MHAVYTTLLTSNPPDPVVARAMAIGWIEIKIGLILLLGAILVFGWVLVKRHEAKSR